MKSTSLVENSKKRTTALSGQHPRGTKDWTGQRAMDLLGVQQYWFHIAKQFGYQAIILPHFEHAKTFQNNIGNYTDIVKKELYSFTDKSNRALALRPEFTSSVLRAVFEHKMLDNEPTWGEGVKLAYFGSCFRYERSQTGRYREFYQLGIEHLMPQNVKTISKEEKLLKLLKLFFPPLPFTISQGMLYAMDDLNLDEWFKSCKKSYYSFLGTFLTDFFNPNSKNKDFLLNIKINYLGDLIQRLKIIKKLKKELAPFKKQLCLDCQDRLNKNPLLIFDCKIDNKNPFLSSPDFSSSTGSVLFENNFNDSMFLSCIEKINFYARNLKLPFKFTLQPNLVRGINYYSDWVFEIESIDSEVVIGGGGYYIDPFNPEKLNLGFAIGVDRLLDATWYKNNIKKSIFLSHNGLPINKFEVKANVQALLKKIQTFTCKRIIILNFYNLQIKNLKKENKIGEDKKENIAMNAKQFIENLSISCSQYFDYFTIDSNLNFNNLNQLEDSKTWIEFLNCYKDFNFLIVLKITNEYKLIGKIVFLRSYEQKINKLKKIPNHFISVEEIKNIFEHLDEYL